MQSNCQYLRKENFFGYEVETKPCNISVTNLGYEPYFCLYFRKLSFFIYNVKYYCKQKFQVKKKIIKILKVYFFFWFLSTKEYTRYVLKRLCTVNTAIEKDVEVKLHR